MNHPATMPGGPCPPNTPLIEGGQGTPRKETPVTVWVLVNEMTRNAHAAHSPDQGRRYMEWIGRAEATGRATVHGPICLVGNNWAVECDTSAEADWLTGWLIESCGFTPTMLRTTSQQPRFP